MQRKVRRGLQQRAKLDLEQPRIPESEADPSDPECRIGFNASGSIAGRFVATDVERAENDRTSRHRSSDASVQRPLFIETRWDASAKKQQLGSEQANAVRPGGGGLLDFAD